jgi:molybdopterin converting factor small subunit
MGKIEVRGFGDIKKLFDERGLSFPVQCELTEECSASDLAARLEVPLEKIEIIFINGRVQSLDHPVKAGDRVAFVPPGTPGPYRVILGFVQKKNPGC